MWLARVLCCLVLLFLLEVPAYAAVRGKQVMYVGGTITAVPEKTEGKLDLSNEASAIFIAKRGSFAVPYKTISSIEYGQKVGRRVGVALAVSPVALLSKKRRHYVSVAFVDEEGNKQGVVFECAKGTVHSVVKALEARSGKSVEFESEEAKKHYDKEAK